MRTKTLRFGLLVVLGLLACAAKQASAGLFVPVSGSDTIIYGSSNPVDDGYVGPTSLNFNMPFFGTSESQVYIGSNGYLTFGSGDTAWLSYGFPTDGQGRIAPFFNDLYVPPGDVRYNNETTGEFVAIWNGVALRNDLTQLIAAEAVLLGAGNPFGATAGTIVFSYGAIAGADSRASVGLNEGANLGFATPSSFVTGMWSTGWIFPSSAASLSNRSFTFTPNGADYTVAEGTPQAPGNLTATPEPSTAVTTGVAGLVAAAYAWGRRRAA